MNENWDIESLRRIQRQIRVIAILDGAEVAGLVPVPVVQFHTIAYFADALAPVWGLRILDAQLLKRRSGPLSPLFQRDVDLLVGCGVVIPSDVQHVRDADQTWRLEAKYRLNRELASPILDAIDALEQQADHLAFVRELVQAMSALGVIGIATATTADAAYGDDMIDFGSLVDIEGTGVQSNVTARVAMRFGTLLREEARLTCAEMIHFYVRELHKRMGRVA